MRYHEYMLKGGQGDKETPFVGYDTGSEDLEPIEEGPEKEFKVGDKVADLSQKTGYIRDEGPDKGKFVSTGIVTKVHDDGWLGVIFDGVPNELLTKKAHVTLVRYEDQVNSPSHYGQGNIECIEYIRDSLTHEEYLGYLQGNLKKYTHRWRYKKGAEDLKKADVYLTWLIEAAEKGDKG